MKDAQTESTEPNRNLEPNQAKIFQFGSVRLCSKFRFRFKFRFRLSSYYLEPIGFGLIRFGTRTESKLRTPMSIAVSF